MNAADAIYAGFADIYIPKDEWSDVIDDLEKTGDDFSPSKIFKKTWRSQLYKNRKFFTGCI